MLCLANLVGLGPSLTCVGCQAGAIVEQFQCSQLRERLHKRCDMLIAFAAFSNLGVVVMSLVIPIRAQDEGSQVSAGQ